MLKRIEVVHELEEEKDPEAIAASGRRENDRDPTEILKEMMEIKDFVDWGYSIRLEALAMEWLRSRGSSSTVLVQDPSQYGYQGEPLPERSGGEAERRRRAKLPIRLYVRRLRNGRLYPTFKESNNDLDTL